MSQVCKNVEQEGKLLGYVLSRFRADISMEVAFQFFFRFRSSLRPAHCCFYSSWLFFQLLNMSFHFPNLIFFLIEIIMIDPVYGISLDGLSATLMWNLDCHQFEEHSGLVMLRLLSVFTFGTKACNIFGWVATKVVQVSRCSQFLAFWSIAIGFRHF